MTATITAETKLNTRGALKLLEEIRAARGADVTIDASRVETLGTLALQVLLSARRTWDEDGHAFGIGEVSDHMQGALALTGLDIDALTARGAA
ncbi:STAS domain-containing protein [Mesobacterium pallidum]|uniref:STAS domain-containing protein n=1 Tax=Mesobacterium pallidum TaxID=2872037 RepID=UPI001EE38D10|nr:STAS domain-containing protein [Mesobacterium pallidum]